MTDAEIEVQSTEDVENVLVKLHMDPTMAHMMEDLDETQRDYVVVVAAQAYYMGEAGGLEKGIKLGMSAAKEFILKAMQEAGHEACSSDSHLINKGEYDGTRCKV